MASHHTWTLVKACKQGQHFPEHYTSENVEVQNFHGLFKTYFSHIKIYVDSHNMPISEFATHFPSPQHQC